MTVVDRGLAEHLGVEFTGRKLGFISVPGHRVEAFEAIVPEVVLEGEALRYEAVAVTEIPKAVKDILRRYGMDENIIIGLLTLGRAGVIPNTAVGRLERVESFIL